MKQYFSIEQKRKKITKDDLLDALLSGGHISSPEEVKILELKTLPQSISSLSNLKNAGKFYKEGEAGKDL